MPHSILIADDEINSREGLQKAILEEGRRVDLAADGVEALELIEKRDYDVLISDIRMPNMGGMELLEKTKAASPNTDVIMLTAYGSIEMAVRAMRLGAYNYLTKPVNLDELDVMLEQVLKKRRIEQENEYHRESSKSQPGAGGIIGQSKPIQDLMETIEQVAPSKATVLITGETGSGKELVARAIHDLSPRKDRLFVPIHCAALSENLLESELFGHERGAFTGAVKQRKGRFEVADGGTLFLDEISEISPAIQVKLLRVLQEKQFERVGGSETISVDIRIIAATNRSLQELVEKSEFREDLFYRLKVITIDTPSLRERQDDIPLLVNTFVQRYAQENERGAIKIDKAAMERLKRYAWPGNVRELQGVIESMVLLTRGEVIEVKNVPREIRGDDDDDAPALQSIDADATLSDVEKQVILDALKRHDGNRTKTAEALGIGRRTLIRKLHEYGAEKDDDANDED
ncbi:MAG: sigma-54 dependent transcriptional regulator [Candidatus Hinthialibacter antarcticus]|nr:sigma-54 dependent transcriptional regulator [Candidatus Hinthialibacter antarcticus]